MPACLRADRCGDINVPDGVEAAWPAELHGQDMHIVLTTAAATSCSQWRMDSKNPYHLGIEQGCILVRVRLKRSEQVRTQYHRLRDCCKGD